MDWDAIYSRVITATGWTWEYIDEFLTLPRLNALSRYWELIPPTHITAALFAGVKPASDGERSAQSAPRQIDNADVVRDMHTDPRGLKWRKHG